MATASEPTIVDATLATRPAGLTPAEVLQQRKRFGPNKLTDNASNRTWQILRGIVTEPMFVLLVVTAGVYMVIGSYQEGFTMLGAIVIVAGISLYQEARSDKALRALQQLSQPLAHVRRAGELVDVRAEDVVVEDVLLVSEGEQVVADGLVLEAHDAQADESFLTGESLPVDKAADGKQAVYLGSTLTSGAVWARVTAVGSQTRLGKIGGLMQEVKPEQTPLQRQIAVFVRRMALVGIVAFVLVFGYNWWESGSLVHGLLHGLALAMAVLPEEIPVALSTFMALGAWRLMKQGILTKQPQTVEALGSATVIGVDKTGTLTQNRMTLTRAYCPGDTAPWKIQPGMVLTPAQARLLATAMWASEPQPFDPMEKALHEAYAKFSSVDERPRFQLVHEYPLGGHPPMMTHVFAAADGRKIIACKGAPEGIKALSHLSTAEQQATQQALETLTATGLRVLGVAWSEFAGQEYPEQQQDFSWQFAGLVGFSDPPKENITQVLEQFYQAGIQVKIITGDNAVTAAAIARQIGFRHPEPVLTGAEVMALDDNALTQRVKQVGLYARMFPEAKLRVINALKANGEVTAMTGDGVNDGPALKAAHIGIAMGHRGTELARQAASLVLLDDDLSRMVTAIGFGRRIYDNLKKAVQYIISIHIPLILTVLVPSLLAWKYPALFGPVHVIFLELLMGPTCSIVFENEPMEAGTMLEKPRPASDTFLSFRELGLSIVQGSVVAAGVLGVYFYSLQVAHSETLTRTLVFTTLVLANMGLTLVSRSRHLTVLTTLRYRNLLVPLALGITLMLLVLCLAFSPMQHLFQLQPLTLRQLAICGAVALVSVGWFEVYKAIRYRGASTYERNSMIA